MSRLSGWAGRVLREFTCARVLMALHREVVLLDREIQNAPPRSSDVYLTRLRGKRDGLDHAINLIETEYR